MTKQINYGERYLIHARAAEAKRRMDEAIVALKKAEDEWHQACIECDRVDGEQASMDDIANRLRREIQDWHECALYDALMSGPVFKGWNRSALERCRVKYVDKERKE